MKKMKRFLALVLTLVLVVGLIPATALPAKAAEIAKGNVVDGAAFFSDLHSYRKDLKTTNVSSVMAVLKGTGVPYSSVTSCGDAYSVNEDSSTDEKFKIYKGETATLAAAIRGASGLGDSSLDVNFVWSDHDRYAVQEDGTTLLDKTSHVAYGAGQDGIVGTNDDGNYYVYALSMADLSSNDRYSAGYLSNRANNGFTSSVETAINNFKAEAAKMHKDRPLLIASHLPLLHVAKRADNGCAYDWATAINAVAENMDVVFFHGHNHKYDPDGASYYYGKNSTMPVYNGSSSKNVALNFAHVNIGYLEPTSSNSYSNTTTRQGVVVGVVIYENAITLTAYDKNGVYDGSLAPLNVEIKRDHKVTEPTINEVHDIATINGREEENGYYMQAKALGLTGMTATYAYEKYEDLLKATFTDGLAFEIALEGHTAGNSINYYFEKDDDIPDDELVLYAVGENNALTPIDYELVTENSITYISFTSTHVGTFIYGTPVVDEGYELSDLVVDYQGATQYQVGDTFDMFNITVTGIYTKDGAEDINKEIPQKGVNVEDGYEFTRPDMTTAGKKTITITYGGLSKSFEIDVLGPVADANGTGVTVSAPGVTKVNVTVAEKTVEGYSAYVTFDINLEGYTQGDVATVTVPAPASFDPDKSVVILDEGKIIATTNIENGKITFTTNHFSKYDAAQIDLGDVKEWKLISTTEGKTVFKLTDSLAIGKKYVIVNRNTAGNGNAVNLNNSSINSTSVTVKNDANGIYIEAPSTTAQWNYNSKSKFQNISSKNGYLRGNSDGKNLRSTTSNKDNYTTWLSDDSGLYTTRNNTNYYINESLSMTSKGSSDNRVYLYVEDSLPGASVYAGMAASQTTFNFKLGETTEAQITAAIKAAIKVYEASDANGTGAKEVTNYTLNVNPNQEDNQPVSIMYNNVEVGIVTVNLSTGPSLQITENGEVVNDVIIRSNAKVGDKVQLAAQTNMSGGTIVWSISDDYASMATVDQNGLVTFKTNSAHFFVNATWTINGETKTDSVEITVTPHSYITPEQGTNDFPEYDNEGAIRFDKTAEAVGNFSETGIAQLELSMTGIPYGKGVDVVVVLDTSSSMKKDKNGKDQTSYTSTNARYQIMRESLRDMLTAFDGANVDLAIVDFNGFSSDPNNDNDKTNNINNANFPSGGQSDRVKANKGKVYTGDQANTYILNTTLGARHFENTAADAFNETRINQIYGYFTGGSSGTNYDFGIESAYKLLAAKKAANETNGEVRDQYVIFLTDGAPFRYNGFMAHSSDGRNEMDKLLSGEYADAAALKAAYSWMPDDVAAMNNTVNGAHLHRMAEAIKGTPGETYYAVDSTATTPYLKPFEGLGAKFYAIGFCIADDKTSDSSTDIVYEATSYEVIRNLSSGEGYYWEDVEDKTALSGAFVNIAGKITEAATGIVVMDKITPEYTMVFDIPTGYSENVNANVQAALANQEFYIEVGNYALNNKHERGAFTSAMKVYLGVRNNTYYAASNKTGADYAAPVFTAASEGKRYWSVVDSSFVAGPDDIIVKVGNTTYRFMELGDGTHNMTAGAYAYGTINDKNMSQDLVIATPYFAYSAATKTLSWTIDKVEEFKEIALRYFLYLNDSATEIGHEGVEKEAGTYPTNKWAHLTYTNHLNHVCRQEFPIPQLTWNGAQVSYVFYLVNSQGQPINKAGEVVNFANATFITQVFTESVIWNDTNTPVTGTEDEMEGVAYLDANWFAKQKLPEGYNLYDDQAYYELKVYEDHEGNILDSYFKIAGSEDSGATTGSTTKVYNTKGGVKYSIYKTYTESDVEDNFDFANTTVAFAVVWELALVPDTVVVDFGLDVLINVVQNDLLQNSLVGLSATSRGDAMNTAIKTGSATFKATELNLKDGKYTAKIENDAQIRFTQNDNMEFTEPVDFYYETSSVDYAEGKARTGYLYSKVTVIPATTVYYEDDFVDYKVYSKQSDGWTLVENATWGNAGSGINANQAQDRPGVSQMFASLDADNIYGYDGAYNTSSTYSLGSARYITVDAAKYGTAQFTFYGTGFDVVSLTSNNTGFITVDIYAGTDTTATAVKTLGVDTYYGYKQNADGSWVVDNDAKNSLFQVPVISYEGLTYGQYTVVITAAYNSYLDHNTSDSTYEFYLDAIRIYDPAGVAQGKDEQNANKDVIFDAYIADGEAYPTYQELRANIIAASNVSVALDSHGKLVATLTNGNDTIESLDGAVFIDGSAAEYSISDYVSYGPNNELYLAQNQAIAFNVNPNSKTGHTIADVQLGMKSANGNSVTYTINGKENTIATSTDMYYSIKDYAIGTNGTANTVTIKNTSDSVLSLTNIKVTYKPDATTPAPASDDVNTPAPASDDGINPASLIYVDADTVTTSLMSLRKAPVIEEEVPEGDTPEIDIPEDDTPEDDTPEDDTPEVDVPEEDVPEESKPGNNKPGNNKPGNGNWPGFGNWPGIGGNKPGNNNKPNNSNQFAGMMESIKNMFNQFTNGQNNWFNGWFK